MKRVIKAAKNNVDTNQLIEEAAQKCLKLLDAGILSEDEYQEVREILYRNYQSN